MEDITLLNNTDIENTVKNNSLVELSNLTKKCAHCKKIKNKSEFQKNNNAKDGLVIICRSCVKIKSKIYYNKNRDTILQKSKIDYLKNKEKHAEASKIYRQKYKEEIKIRKRIYTERNAAKIKIRKHEEYIRNKKRYQASRKAWKLKNMDTYKAYRNQPKIKIENNLRKALHKIIKLNKSKIHIPLFMGASSNITINHLESQFTPEMNWFNYGKYWNIDHIIPISIFDVLNKDHHKLINHYLNLRPMPSSENFSKNDKCNGKSVRHMTQEEKNLIINEFAAKVAALEEAEKQNN